MAGGLCVCSAGWLAQGAAESLFECPDHDVSQRALARGGAEFPCLGVVAWDVARGASGVEEMERGGNFKLQTPNSRKAPYSKLQDGEWSPDSLVRAIPFRW